MDAQLQATKSTKISCSPNRYCRSITFRNFTVLDPTLIAWHLKTPSFDRFSATLRTNRLRMEARTTETETMLSTARMALSIIGSHSRFCNACYGCLNFRLRKTNFTSSLRITFKGVQLERSIWEGGIEETPNYLITFLLDESCIKKFCNTQ